MMEPRSNSFAASEISREILRKLLHLPGLFLPLFFFYWPKLSAILLSLLIILYLISEWFRHTGRILPLIGTLTQKLARSEKIDLAPVYLAIGLGTACYFFSFQEALVGAWMVCVSDGMAAIIGRRFGRKKIGRLKKSYWGSFTFFATSLWGIVPILGWKAGLLVSGIGMILEIFSSKGLDNLILPLVGAALAKYLGN